MVKSKLEIHLEIRFGFRKKILLKKYVFYILPW